MREIVITCEKGIKVDKIFFRKIVVKLKTELSFEINALEINFLTSHTLKGINKKYLHHNYRTDIITFDYSNERNILDGEILISFEDAVRNSKLYNVSVKNELLRLVIHGILHLVGYDDKTELKRKKMKVIENRLVNKYSFKSTRKL